MKFYNILPVEDGRIRLAPHFSAGESVVFSYDDTKSAFEVNLIFEEEGEPSSEAALVGEVSVVREDGTVELPWWIRETIEWCNGFLAAPMYSWMQERVLEMDLVPIVVDELRKKWSTQNFNPGRKKKSQDARIRDICNGGDEMLRAMFGDDFDTTLGIPKVVR